MADRIINLSERSVISLTMDSLNVEGRREENVTIVR